MTFNPKQEYIITETTISIEDFYKYKEDYVTRPPYQRKTVWGDSKKQSLMDSIFRRYYVPKLVIREVRLGENKIVKEIIDGQQRITTIQDFFENKFKLPESLNDIDSNLGGKFYKDLNVDIRRFIDRDLKLSADIVKNIENPNNPEHQKVATEIFWRLQQGESLNFMEEEHAKLNSLSRNVIVKYSDDITFDYEKYEPKDNNKNKHKFFKIIDQKNNRMQHLMLFARFLILERKGGYAELNNKSIRDFIDEYKRDNGIGNYSLEEEGFVKESIKNLNLFYDFFKNDPMIVGGGKIKEFSSEYFIISTYLLLRHLRNKYVVDENLKHNFRNFIYEFFKRWKKKRSNDNEILNFEANRQQGLNNIKERDVILRKLFFEYLKENNKKIILKDNKRAFNELDRILVYRRDGGLCQQCLAEGKSEEDALVPWDKYQTDHIFPHSLGGETSIENAQVLCEYHNKHKSNKI